MIDLAEAILKPDIPRRTGPSADSFLRDLPEVTAQSIPVINRWCQPLTPYRVVMAGKPYRLVANLGTAPETACRIPFGYGSHLAVASLTDRFIERVLAANYDVEQVNGLPEHQQQLLLELGFSDFIQTVEEACGMPLTLCPAAEKVDPLNRIDLEFLLVSEEDDFQTRLWLEMPIGEAERLITHFESSCSVLSNSSNKLPLMVSIKAGWQILYRDEIGGLAKDDIIMLQHSTDHYWASIQGRAAASLRSLNGGDFKITSQLFSRVPQAPDDALIGTEHFHYSESSQQSEVSMDNQLPNNHQVSSLEDVPLCLVCEVGRLEMPLDSVRQLGEGSILKIKGDREEVVQVMMNGQKIARGELIKVGDGLGVRLTKLYINE